MRLIDLECSGIISKAWACNTEGTPMLVATKKLKKCKKMLKAWHRDNFGSVLQKIKRTKKLLWKAEEVSARSGSIEKVRRLKIELNELYDKEERMWQQRSWLQWLKCGDQNTKFFHGSATQRKRRNFIKGLGDEDGTWHEDEDVFSGMLTTFYVDLFTSSNPHDLERALDGVQSVVTEEMRIDLARPYTVEEVEFAIKEMAPLKAPRPDRMPPLFYQVYWTEVGGCLSSCLV